VVDLHLAKVLRQQGCALGWFVDIQGVQRHSLRSVPIRDGAAIRVSPMTAYPTDIVGGLA